MADNFRIKTPHAAVLIWNYVDRIDTPTGEFDATGVTKLNEIENETKPVIVSTLSCVSIQTNKSKSSPEGSFNLVLAPYKNWTSTLTAGSWCAVLMSNTPITEDDLTRADREKVKMLGRIETVRTETNVDDEGARHTMYYVSGIDWGSIFSSQLYIDPLIAASGDPQSLGNSAAAALQALLFGKSGGPESFLVAQNLSNILDVMGSNLGSYKRDQKLIGRLSKGVYDISFPNGVQKYFSFTNADSQPSTAISNIINLETGSLHAPEVYKDVGESVGFVNPFSLSGSHTIWQILMENSNPVLNEMFCDLVWASAEDGGDQAYLQLYNRIKPFSFKNFKPGATISEKEIKSFFQHLPMHDLDTIEVMSVNAGTNWRDKINFIEIRPEASEFEVFANAYLQKSQVFDAESFNREGMRSMILTTRQFPSTRVASNDGLGKDLGIDWEDLVIWCNLLREWYFGTHRLLNGTIVLHGTNDYIGVGNNIRFEAKLLNPNPNINAATKALGENQYILAHVESVSHQFTVSGEGSRSFTTTINFVRGIVTYENGETVGQGLLDVNAAGLSQSDDRNRKNVISTSTDQDPDPQTIEGT
jgi:hypothetical protein